MRARAASLVQRLHRARLRFAVAALALFPASAVVHADAVSEQELKAALLYRAARFIEWPASAFPTARSPFVMCIVGDASAAKAFESVRNKPLHARPIVITQIAGDMLDVRQCHIAYFPAATKADIDYALTSSAGAPVLTVGESEVFAKRGGMFALVTREQRVQFAVNVAATKRGGLVVSSQLLTLATLVAEDPR